MRWRDMLNKRLQEAGLHTSGTAVTDCLALLAFLHPPSPAGTSKTEHVVLLSLTKAQEELYKVYLEEMMGINRKK